jgi:hypothetical protein
MARPAIATLLGLLGFAVYVIVAVALADRITRQWAVQLGYFVLAGTLWVLPARWLMLWAAHRR